MELEADPDDVAREVAETLSLLSQGNKPYKEVSKDVADEMAETVSLLRQGARPSEAQLITALRRYACWVCGARAANHDDNISHMVTHLQAVSDDLLEPMPNALLEVPRRVSPPDLPAPAPFSYQQRFSSATSGPARYSGPLSPPETLSPPCSSWPWTDHRTHFKEPPRFAYSGKKTVTMGNGGVSRNSLVVQINRSDVPQKNGQQQQQQATDGRSPPKQRLIIKIRRVPKRPGAANSAPAAPAPPPSPPLSPLDQHIGERTPSKPLIIRRATVRKHVSGSSSSSPLSSPPTPPHPEKARNPQRLQKNPFSTLQTADSTSPPPKQLILQKGSSYVRNPFSIMKRPAAAALAPLSYSPSKKKLAGDLEKPSVPVDSVLVRKKVDDTKSLGADVNDNIEGVPKAAVQSLFVCAICLKGFADKDQLRVHVAEELRDLNNTVKRGSKKLKKIKAPVKQQKAVRFESPVVKKEEAAKDERNLCCNVCSKRFNRQDHLARHVLTHERHKTHPDGVEKESKVKVVSEAASETLSETTATKPSPSSPQEAVDDNLEVSDGKVPESKAVAKAVAEVKKEVDDDAGAAASRMQTRSAIGGKPPPAATVASDSGAAAPKPRLFTCFSCMREFSRRAKLRNHVAVRHLNQQEAAPFLCPACGLDCENERDLALHQEDHDNERRTLRCGTCGDMLPDRKSMYAHQRQHKP